MNCERGRTNWIVLSSPYRVCYFIVGKLGAEEKWPTTIFISNSHNPGKDATLYKLLTRRARPSGYCSWFTHVSFILLDWHKEPQWLIQLIYTHYFSKAVSSSSSSLFAAVSWQMKYYGADFMLVDLLRNYVPINHMCILSLELIKLTGDLLSPSANRWMCIAAGWKSN